MDRKIRSVSRRDVLKSAAWTLSGLAAFGGRLRAITPGLYAAAPARPAKAKSLVVVFLRGGADALNMIVPYGDDDYRRVRPRIAIPPENRVGSRGVVKLDDRFGLHPGLESLKKLWDRKMFAPIVCTGSPHATRSHFDAQDFMEYAAPGLRTMKDGWLNRYLEATKARVQGDLGLRGLAMQRLLPRSLRGRFPVLAVPDAAKAETERVLDLFDDVYEKKDGEQAGMMDERNDDGAPSVAVGRSTIETLRRLYAILDAKPATGAATAAGYLKSDFGRQMQRIAAVIKAGAGLEVASVDVAGWDHHVREGGADGDFAKRTRDVADNIVAFAEDLGPLFMDTVVMVMSEFGRTVYENGNEGTDHGHGSCMLLAGGSMHGGQVYGKWTGLADKNLYEGRDLAATTDFRAVFDEVLTGHLGFDPSKDFFPKYDRARPLKLFA